MMDSKGLRVYSHPRVYPYPTRTYGSGRMGRCTVLRVGSGTGSIYGVHGYTGVPGFYTVWKTSFHTSVTKKNFLLLLFDNVRNFCFNWILERYVGDHRPLLSGGPPHYPIKIKTRSALGVAHVPPTNVCRRLTDSVNKTIVKPRVAAAANTYTSDFSDVKFRVPALIR